MKRIVLLLFILFTSLSCFAQNADTTNIIDSALKGIEFKSNEYIVVSAKNSELGKLNDFNVNWLNISSDKASVVIEKLQSLPPLFKNDGDEITIYIGKKPEYEKSKSFAVAYFSTDKKTKALNKAMQGYLMYFRTKLYLTWNQSKDAAPILIYCEIDKNGNVTSYNVLKSAGEAVDKRLLETLKQSASTIKPLQLENNVLPMLISFGIKDKIIEKTLKNVDISFDKNFYTVIEIELDERGDLVSADIETSSDDEAIDNELINAIKKTANFSDVINFEEKNKINYIQFRGLKNYKYIGAVVNEENSAAINWVPYLQEVELQAKKNWVPPKSREFYLVKTFLLIDAQGQIKDKKILQSSGNKAADEAILKSIEQGIYPKLPDKFEGNMMPVEISFSYVVQNSSNERMEKLKKNPWLHF